MQDFDWLEFTKRLEKLIAYVSSATRTPINGELWEEVIYHTLRSMGSKYQGGGPKWVSGSHAPGADLWIDEFGISAKAGNIKNDRLVISSYRLTRFADLESMIAYIDGPGKNFDIYLCCARIDTANQRTYNVFVVPNDAFAASELKWTELLSQKDNKISGWRGINDQGVIVSIYKSMSNQLWIELPLSACRSLLQVNIPKASLGQSLEAILK
jgi:hypothetical protein